jgi:hypothetical protein
MSYLYTGINHHPLHIFFIIYLCIYDAISNGKWKHRGFSLIHWPFAHCANGSLLFVRLFLKLQTEVVCLQTDWTDWMDLPTYAEKQCCGAARSQNIWPEPVLESVFVVSLLLLSSALGQTKVGDRFIIHVEQDQASDLNLVFSQKSWKLYILIEKLCKQVPTKLKSEPELERKHYWKVKATCIFIHRLVP